MDKITKKTGGSFFGGSLFFSPRKKNIWIHPFLSPETPPIRGSKVQRESLKRHHHIEELTRMGE